MRIVIVVLCLIAVAAAASTSARTDDAMVRVGPRRFERAQSAPGQATTVDVPAFLLDVTPVTNARFLDFVRAHPEWQRGNAPGLFVDEGYLSAWAGPVDLGVSRARAPVVFVSWFAARAYCEAQGKRLPTTDEWELAAAASAQADDGRGDPGFVEQILAWYAAPTPRVFPDVGGAPNRWGVRDLHGLVWEHVEDFSATFIKGDARGDKSRDVVDFCGGGALNARDPSDYASFMRFAFRSALEGRTTTGSLGFRCAKDAPSRRGVR